MDSVGNRQIFQFGEFRVDGPSRRIFHNGEAVPVTSKVFDTLLYLVARHGQIVDKNDLIQDIWPDTIVEENNLNKNISKLRQIFGEKPGEHRFIATVPGKGYKFVAPVTVADPPDLPNNLTPPARTSGPPPSESRTPPRKKYWIIPAIVIGAVAILFAATAYFLAPRSERSDASRPTTLAILPFKPLTAENRDESLELGMADTLISRLSSDPGLVVTPLGSVRRFGRVEQDPHAAGRELGVDRVLEGSIQRAGNDIRVNVRLIDITSGVTVWNGTYDEEFTNIFSVQDRITAKLAEALKLRFASGNRQDQDSRNPEAYRLFLQGRYYTQKVRPPEVRRGIEFFQKAIDLDPTYARAYAGMADAFRMLPINGDIPSADVMPKAKAAALKALEIDPANADAHIALGWVGFWYEHDWAAAEEHFKKALTLSPNNADAYRGYSVLLTCTGRHEAAIDAMAKARALDPLSLITGALEGQTFLFAGHYPRAVESLNKTFEIDPNFWVAHIQLSRILIQQNDFDGAVAAAERAVTTSGGNSEAISLSGYASAKSGRTEKAEEAVRLLKDMKTKGLATEYNTAMVLNGLGLTDEALSSLERGFAERDVRLILLKVDPKWNDLRSHPRFAALIRQMNLE